MLNLCEENDGRAAGVLDKVVRENRDPLVVPACVPEASTELAMRYAAYLKSRFSAKRWIDAQVSRNERAKASYETLLCRAFLLTPGLELANETLETDAMIDAMESEIRRVLSAKNPPRVHNLNKVREHAIAGAILKRYEEQFPEEVMRYEYFYDALVQSLGTWLPPVDIVGRFFGEEEAENYRGLLETAAETHEIDIDEALRRGEQRQRSGGGLWNTFECGRALRLLGLYCEGKERRLQRVEVGEQYEAHRKQDTAHKNRGRAAQISMARTLGVWRPRRAEASKWKAALGDKDFATLQKCNAALRDDLPSGVYSQIPRRFCNPASIEDMKEQNLPKLCEMFDM